MTNTPPDLDGTHGTIPRIPSWAGVTRAETLEDAVFLSGAAVSALHLMLTHADVPHGLLRERLALRAAECCVGFIGRPEQAAALRDEVHLLRPDDQPGPAGAIYHLWRRAVSRPIAADALARALPDAIADRVPACLEVTGGNAVKAAAHVLEAVLADFPREEASALILADAALARALGWTHTVPLLALGLKRRDLHKTGDDLRLSCHRAVVMSAAIAAPMAADLARRAGRLVAVAPKLRARGSGAAVDLFLGRDALPASALTGLMSDRAARRFCDRLVTLGAVRELTGRTTFRLYGV